MGRPAFALNLVAIERWESGDHRPQPINAANGHCAARQP
jgi:hypothetical protein